MRVKALFISAIIGMAVVTGIFKGLTSARNGEKKEGGEKDGRRKSRSPDVGNSDGR